MCVHYLEKCATNDFIWKIDLLYQLTHSNLFDSKTNELQSLQIVSINLSTVFGMDNLPNIWIKINDNI